MTDVQDFGFVSAGEMHRIMREYPELRFVLCRDTNEDETEPAVYDADSPEFQNWNPTQIPTDDYQRALRLEGRSRRPGRPPRIHSVRRLTIELPSDLLNQLDATATNRTAFIERAIRAALASQDGATIE